MHKGFPRCWRIFCFSFISVLFTLSSAFAQSITIKDVDAGPYTPGSTITAHLLIDNSGGCIKQNNVYNLYLSDPSGGFTSKILIGSISGFYTGFINGTLPSSIPPGVNYKLKVEATQPALSSNESASFQVVAGTAIETKVFGQAVNASNPEVYGLCDGQEGYSFNFFNGTPNAVTSLVFYNELTHSSEGTATLPNTYYSFTAKAANYTVIAKSVSANGTIATKSYLLLNNKTNNVIESTGNNSVCLTENKGDIVFSIVPGSLVSNYPGNIYQLNFGDGTSVSLTYCEIVASGGKVPHTYKFSSCGAGDNQNKSAFRVQLQPTNNYCGSTGTAVNTFAKVFETPYNKWYITDNTTNAICLNSEIRFVNKSYPGQNPSSTDASCLNDAALYTWSVDDVPVKFNARIGENFLYTFNAPGKHKVTLTLQGGSTTCSIAVFDDYVYVQNAPTPVFTVPGRICSSASVTPNTTGTTVDNSFPVFTNKYLWTVTGPGTVNYLNNTTNTSTSPQFKFTTPGAYNVKLSITTSGCGAVEAPVQTIVVDGPPTAVMTGNKSLCSKDVAILFSPDGGDTKTTFTGTVVPAADTYTWAITGGAYDFTNGTDAHTQYPNIIFHDNATYIISVVHKNECNSVTASQQLTFQDAPAVDPGSYAPVCSSEKLITLSNANVGSGATFVWQTTTGGTFSNPNTLNPAYTFSAADIAAGKVTLNLHATTGLSGVCGVIDRPVTITILPQPIVNSAATYARCSGQAMDYTITTTVPAATFTWTASSADVTGFTASGSGSNITDILAVNGTTAGTVIYKITPMAQGCNGAPFTLTVNVSPLPVVSTPSATLDICSGQPANVALSSNTTGAGYTWTSTVTGNVSGNTSANSPVGRTAINDVLVNTSTTEAATVTYQITVYNSAGCSGNTITVTRTVKPAPVQAVISNPKVPVCNVTELQLQGNDAGPGTGTWTELTGKNVQFSDIHNPVAIVKGLVPGNTYQFKWRIDAASGCTPTEDVFNLQVDKQSIGGTTTAVAPVCAGANTGSITVNGYTGAIIRWESSIDNFATAGTIISSTNASISFNNLSLTTYYRAVVKSGSCDFAYSTASTVTVNPALASVKINPVTPPCNETTMVLSAADPGTYTGTWTIVSPVNSGATIDDMHSANIKVDHLTPGITYTFQWTVTTSTCGIQSDKVTFTDKLDVQPAFVPTQTNSCGTALIKMRNTSFGDVTTAPVGTSFEWYVDGKLASSDFSPRLSLPALTSTDHVYKVELKITSNCSTLSTAEKDILVSPAQPVANLNPGVLSGCSPLAPMLEVPLAGGNNKYYDYFITDLSTGVTRPMVRMLDATPPVIDPLVATSASKKFSIYLRVTDNCGNTSNSLTYQYTVSPADVVPIFAIKDSKTAYCLGESITLQNGTAGGTQYYYTITNQTTSLTETIQGTATELPYTLKAAGKYAIKITAISACKPAGISSAEKLVTVYGAPAPNFSADKTTACSSITVQFSNTTPTDPAGTPAQSLTYAWDFGDNKGTDKSFAPKHTYITPGKYTVTLTATNIATGCVDVMRKTSFITVTAPPVTDFSVNPDTVISIPDYKFTFTDETTGTTPTNWRWTFGDGSPAEFSRNATHTYADTGRYTVTLTTADGTNCPSTKTRHVRITGVPGQLFVPNAFIPTSITEEMRTFKAKGSGIKAFRMQIFNNYGQLIWETTQLNAKGEPTEGWDGTYRGSPVQQGVYIWQMSATFINGNEWKGMSYNKGLPKRTGVINLIR
jgi:PKD repeat protein